MNKIKISLAEVISLISASFFGYISFLSLNFLWMGDIRKSIIDSVVISIILWVFVLIIKKIKSAKRNFQQNAIFELIALALYIIFAFVISTKPFSHYITVNDRKEDIKAKIIKNIDNTIIMFDKYEKYANNRISLYEEQLNTGIQGKDINPNVEQMQQLYGFEQTCRDNNFTVWHKLQVRQQMALPILEQLGKWMKEQYIQTLPKSPIGKALSYSIERWDRLCLYTTNGILNIDNNPVENSIRPVAIGRKNYLFCGSHEAAKRTAMLYSLLGTCKMNNINPFNWLKDILQRLPSYSINNIKELLPHRWVQMQN